MDVEAVSEHKHVARLKVYVAAEAAKQADIIMILINDELQADMYLKALLFCSLP